ncbi:MAG TPA: PAS domain S-box protein [Nitrospiraceae bacterium]|nr:PAS domain S-box protein [Nitrospiraceae bacterium]
MARKTREPPRRKPPARQGSGFEQTAEDMARLIEGIRDCAIFMLDRNGMVISWNPGAERIKGYSTDEIVGRHFSSFYTPEDRNSGLPQHALRVAEETGKFEGEGWRVRKDGTKFWASVLIDALRRNETLVGFAKITRDMTERRLMQEQLHQSQKMEAIGQLTGGVAHDFNNLLTVILGNLEKASRLLKPDQERCRRCVDQALQASQRAATLTQQLLAFARRQPLRPKPTDINQLVRQWVDLMRRTLPESVNTRAVLDEVAGVANVDANQLESSLLNLAINARDAMPNGGTLTLETATTTVSDRDARLMDLRPGAYVLICMSDTGTGMTPEVMQRAFDPFFTTKPIGQGTGLGLSQVFGFVKQSEGHIKIYSRLGQGTTVKIYLPRVDGANSSLPDPRAGHPQSGGARAETILVVEDNDAVRLFTTDTLRDFGFNVMEAVDASEALSILDKNRHIDLLFTDIGLPGLNGRELAATVQRRYPGVRTLFTSGYAQMPAPIGTSELADIPLLSKPFTRAQLYQMITEILGDLTTKS